MATIKAYTDIEQSKKLAKIFPLESADLYWSSGNIKFMDDDYDSNVVQHIPCWSFTALFDVLPEINDVSVKMEKVKAEDGYNGYYYHIEYEGIVLIPYSKNPIDACYEMILKLHELNLL